MGLESFTEQIRVEKAVSSLMGQGGPNSPFTNPTIVEERPRRAHELDGASRTENGKAENCRAEILVSHCAAEVLLDEEIDLDRLGGRWQTPDRLESNRTDSIDLALGEEEPATKGLARRWSFSQGAP